MLSEQLLQLSILFRKGIFISCNGTEGFLQAQDFLFEGLDVQLFPFSMSSSIYELGGSRMARRHLPLRLSVQFLSSCQCGFAVWFGTSSFRWLTINCKKADISDRNNNLHRLHSPRTLFFSVNVFRNPKLIDRGLFPPSEWPLPYALPPGFPYCSTGEAEDMAIGFGDG